MRGRLRRIDAPVGVAILFSSLLPLIQISLHVVAKSRLVTGDPAAQQTGIGVLYNLPDALSYASWSAQAKWGYVTFVDLFTTEVHTRALFNLYFLIVGFLSRVIGIDPLSLMEISSFALGPLSIFAILLIARGLKFDASAQVTSLVFVLLGSGLSGLMIMLETLCFPLLRPGADGYYLDLFPLTSLVLCPFAENSMAFSTGGPGFFLKGFGILWGFAALGLMFAIADRKRDLCFVACWAIVGAALLCFSPSYGSKFAGGSVLPNGLLAAYGIGRLLQARPGIARPLVVCAIGVMSLTPIGAFSDILQARAPRIDYEVLSPEK